MGDNMFGVFIRFLFILTILVYRSEQRGSSSSGRGGSSGGAIGFSSFQGPPIASKINFPKYVAGASIAFLADQGLRPYYFSSSTHRYEKDWLVRQRLTYWKFLRFIQTAFAGRYLYSHRVHKRFISCIR